MLSVYVEIRSSFSVIFSFLCTSWPQDPGVQVQQLQTCSLVGSEHRELRQGSREGIPPSAPLRLVCTGTGEHPSQMVK